MKRSLVFLATMDDLINVPLLRMIIFLDHHILSRLLTLGRDA